MFRIAVTVAAAAFLAACGGNSDAEEATEFIKPGTPVPSSAELKENDVPRDDYGRPFSYEYLGSALPTVSGTMVSGEAFSSSNLEGQWTVIQVWGLWCSDSLADAPYAAALASAIAQDPELRFMTVVTPPSAERADDIFGKYKSVEAYYDEKGYSFPTLVDEDASIREAISIDWTPSYLLVAPDLTVQGFRSDLSAAEGEPVKDFIRDIAETRRDYDVD